jgi:hypothetical protein
MRSALATGPLGVLAQMSFGQRTAQNVSTTMPPSVVTNIKHDNAKALSVPSGAAQRCANAIIDLDQIHPEYDRSTFVKTTKIQRTVIRSANAIAVTLLGAAVVCVSPL